MHDCLQECIDIESYACTNASYNMHIESYACWNVSFNMRIESYACYDEGSATTTIWSFEQRLEKINSYIASLYAQGCKLRRPASTSVVGITMGKLFVEVCSCRLHLEFLNLDD